MIFLLPESRGGHLRHITGKGGTLGILDLASIWEASGKHLGSIRVASGKHLEDIWEASRHLGSGKHLVGISGHLGSGRHLRGISGHLGSGIWEASGRHLGSIREASGKHLGSIQIRGELGST